MEVRDVSLKFVHGSDVSPIECKGARGAGRGTGPEDGCHDDEQDARADFVGIRLVGSACHTHDRESGHAAHQMGDAVEQVIADEYEASGGRNPLGAVSRDYVYCHHGFYLRYIHCLAELSQFGPALLWTNAL